jgi:DNA polymerase elongation subunit (family B)
LTAKIQKVANKGYEDALLLVTQAIDKIMTGEGILQQDLAISKLLREDIDKYRSIFPHVYAAIQLRNDTGNSPTKGDTIQYMSIQTHSITILFAGLYI